MGDWAGLIFFIVLAIGVTGGLKLLAKPVKRTEEEFERNAAEGTTSLGASMNALQKLMNPEGAKAREVQTQLKEGRYAKKKQDGRNDPDDDVTSGELS